jgi:hypothetical protein
MAQKAEHLLDPGLIPDPPKKELPGPCAHKSPRQSDSDSVTVQSSMLKTHVAGLSKALPSFLLFPMTFIAKAMPLSNL